MNGAVSIHAEVLELPVSAREFLALKKVERFWISKMRAQKLGTPPFVHQAFKFTSGKNTLYRENEGIDIDSKGWTLHLGDSLRAPSNRGRLFPVQVKHDFENMRIGDRRVVSVLHSRSTQAGHAAVQSFRNRTGLPYSFKCKAVPNGVEVKRIS